MLGWGGGDVNVPCTCAHVGCYARCWVGVGSVVCRRWSTKCGAILMISCPSPSIICPKQPDWSMIRSGSICTVGNGDKMRARTCGPTCTKCLLTEKKDTADSLLKFQRALNPDATLFIYRSFPIVIHSSIHPCIHPSIYLFRYAYHDLFQMLFLVLIILTNK